MQVYGYLLERSQSTGILCDVFCGTGLNFNEWFFLGGWGRGGDIGF